MLLAMEKFMLQRAAPEVRHHQTSGAQMLLSCFVVTPWREPPFTLQFPNRTIADQHHLEAESGTPLPEQAILFRFPCAIRAALIPGWPYLKGHVVPPTARAITIMAMPVDRLDQRPDFCPSLG